MLPNFLSLLSPQFLPLCEGLSLGIQLHHPIAGMCLLFSPILPPPQEHLGLFAENISSDQRSCSFCGAQNLRVCCTRCLSGHSSVSATPSLPLPPTYQPQKPVSPIHLEQNWNPRIWISCILSLLIYYSPRKPIPDGFSLGSHVSPGYILSI